MAQGVVTLRRVEPTVLPRGSEVLLTAQDGTEASFRTMHDLRILPISLERMQVLLRPQGGFRVVLEFHSRFGRSDPVGLLRLHTRYLDDYRTSLRILYNLRTHMERAFVLYDQLANDESDGPLCEVSYGRVPELTDGLDSAHELEEIRSFFHFPEQELYLNVQVPPPRRPWNRFSICFDLDARWPRTPALNIDIFQLFAVPIVNLRKDSAEPIVCDGTQDAYPIRHPSAGRRYALRAVSGVYQVTPPGLVPLRPGTLLGQPAGDSYEIEDRPDQWGGRHYLLLRSPESLLAPRKLNVEASWYQPDFDDHAGEQLRVHIVDRLLEGLNWRVLGTVRPHEESALRGNSFGLLQMLALKMKPVLNKDELLALLSYLNLGVEEGPYRDLPRTIRQLSCVLAPDSALRGSGIRHVYKMKLDSYEPDDEALVWHFLSQVRRVLDVWNHDATVELEVDTSGSPLAMRVRD